jgi:hypothetical protein
MATTTLSSGVYGDQPITSNETLISHSGPSSTAIMNSGGFYTQAINFDATVSDAQVGDLGGHGFTIMATDPGGVAVQMLGSNDALDGNVLIANDPTTNGSGADLITGSAANNLQIDANQFGGVGFALAYVNGALDTYTSSQNVNFLHNTFVGTATAGVDLVDDAASGKINGNSFSGSGDGAIYLGHLSAAAASNAQYGTHYLYEPATITVAKNNFSHWNGADILTFDANYTFATEVALRYVPGMRSIAAPNVDVQPAVGVPTRGQRHPGVKWSRWRASLAADVAGYSKLAAADEERTLARTRAQTGTVRLHIVKAGFIVGVGGGSGTLIYKGRSYRLSLGGIGIGSLGVAAVALVGTAQAH